MILVLEEGLDLGAIQRVEEAVRRAGGDPKRLYGRVADGGVLDGRDAIEAVGVPASLLRGLPGVAIALEAACQYPRVARKGRGTRVVAVPTSRAVARIGGPELTLIMGPCAVESKEQLDACARAVSEAGATILRGGAFKPRTSPYSFQGLGEEGLQMLRAAADRHHLAVITEVMAPDAVACVGEYADLLQVGSRNMQNFALLRAVGKQRRPIMLKRGMSATLEEWLLAAEYIADAGNQNIVLCERGVRTFDAASRNLLDLAAVPLLRDRTDLPIIVDPSHGVGVRRAIPAMCLAAVAAGADGVMIECHPEPGAAKSDAFQALTLDEVATLSQMIAKVAAATRASTEAFPSGR